MDILRCGLALLFLAGTAACDSSSPAPAEGGGAPGPDIVAEPEPDPEPPPEEPGEGGDAEGGSLPGTTTLVKGSDPCTSDADCVKATCCHATACVAQANAPVCKDVACTMDCQGGTMDCGGGCLCHEGVCSANLFSFDAPASSGAGPS